MKITGLILAGGRSTRFGREKAVAAFNGRPMIASVADALLAGCEAVAVNAPLGSGAAAWVLDKGRALLPDPPGRHDGPLTGVFEGLRWAIAIGAEVLITAPCDTPGLPHDVAAQLAQAIADGAPCAYAVSPEGPHPLCAGWRIDRLAFLEAILAEGHPSVRQLLDSWGAALVAFPDSAAFANVNTPGDLSGDASTRRRSTS